MSETQIYLSWACEGKVARFAKQSASTVVKNWHWCGVVYRQDAALIRLKRTFDSFHRSQNREQRASHFRRDWDARYPWYQCGEVVAAIGKAAKVAKELGVKVSYSPPFYFLSFYLCEKKLHSKSMIQLVPSEKREIVYRISNLHCVMEELNPWL